MTINIPMNKSDIYCQKREQKKGHNVLSSLIHQASEQLIIRYNWICTLCSGINDMWKLAHIKTRP